MTKVCMICNGLMENSETINLKCSHDFCWICIEKYLKENLDSKTKCPLHTCFKFINDVEVRQILNKEDIKRYEDICVRSHKNIHKCVLLECDAIMTYDDKNFQYDCQICTIYNCIKCQKAHKGSTCEDAESSKGRSLCEKEIKRAREELKRRMMASNRERIAHFEDKILVPNSEIFNCNICIKCIGKGDGIILRQCFHQICRDCLREHVKSQNIPVMCPFVPCGFRLDDRECREILSESDEEIYETKSLACTSNVLGKTERCRQANCRYICDVDNRIETWTCKVCSSLNCVKCNTIHQNQTCQQYIMSKTKLSKDDTLIEELIRNKKLMKCPKCKMIIDKISGCNLIKCSSCQTELCWINQTFRWGPGGNGDESGGCKCGVGGKLCHPDCQGCNHCSIM